ncbi:MAG: bifunctional UDP-3-O-[3-hydroxymyristoyl] N-acetylglucosamine deacetylase/3-hydroxyacyl-ACP dehydratase [Bacteroidota bacterium]|nr:bifunctional UDP-3-O-[3-hydroxymyristoyl] N-acetylglucosamine deacetylase/3-hydroxyacyl-ACP dehydratase [Bacteroidota bacterium]
MENKQKTIQKSVSISGVGLHTGARVNITFQPAAENHGYKFQRVDLKDKPIINADVDYVIGTERGTTLAKDGVEIGTVEHILAAVAGLEIDNILIELDAKEIPIMDGSSGPFVKALLDAGIKKQSAEKEYFEITSNIHYSEKDSNVEMIAMPLDGFRLTCMIDFKNPIIGSQHASISKLSEFPREIASNRTFCLFTDIEELHNKNLIKGGDVNNAIVVVDKKVTDAELENMSVLFNKDVKDFQVGEDGILNNVKLRYQNEPARHKLLDLIGDLALVGVPLKAQIMAARPGHSANIEFAKKIKKTIKNTIKQKKNQAPVIDINKKAVYNITEIEKILPHRHPFLLVDRILELDEKNIIGIKNVTHDEYFFRGHFPDNPIMPGVLQIEALAQCGGVLVLNNVPDPENYSTYFLKIDKARFKGMVTPGDTLILKLVLTAPVRRGVCMMKAQGFVGNKIVVEAELMAQIVKTK